MSDLSEVPFQELIREIITRLDTDPDREGLDRTPERVEKSLKFLTKGYRMTPDDALGDGIFEERHHNMVMVKDIELYSLCEHHLLPFFGKAHVAHGADRSGGLGQRSAHGRRRGGGGLPSLHDDAGRGEAEFQDHHVGHERSVPE